MTGKVARLDENEKSYFRPMFGTIRKVLTDNQRHRMATNCAVWLHLQIVIRLPQQLVTILLLSNCEFCLAIIFRTPIHYSNSNRFIWKSAQKTIDHWCFPATCSQHEFP